MITICRGRRAGSGWLPVSAIRSEIYRRVRLTTTRYQTPTGQCNLSFLDTMTSVYIDEAAGSDVTGDGSQQAPYQSLAYALFTQGQSAQVLVRKDPNAEYAEPTQSALKKAKKGADGLEKKRKKAGELAEREAQANNEEREKRERLLEESKKIQLVEDAALPAAVKVRTIDARHKRGSFVDTLAGKDSEPHTLTGNACPRPRLGASLALAKGYHLYRASRRYRISAGRTLWRTSAQYGPLARFGLLTSFLGRHKRMMH